MARQTTATVLLFTPILVLNTLRLFVTPLKEMLSVSIELDIILHVICLAIGVLLYRKTKIVRDHEWQRTKAVKSVSNHFRAEESGVWEKDITMDSTLSVEAEANLKGQVSNVTAGNSSEFHEINREVEVQMLVDSEHVRKAQARVSGDEQFNDENVDATFGAVRKNSPMDNLLDWIAKFRGRNSKEERETKSQSSLKSRSQDAPVIAQRPIAPINPIPDESRTKKPMELASMTDEGIQTVEIQSQDTMVAPTQPTMEELAYGVPSDAPPSNIPSSPSFSPKPTCKVCGSPNDVGERFCGNCGSNL